MQEKHEVAREGLCALLDEVNAEQMLVIMVTQLLSHPLIGNDKFGHHPVLIEILTYYIFTDSYSLKGRDVTLMDTTECYKHLEGLFASSRFVNVYGAKKEYDCSLSESVRLESEVVRGNAYVEQTAEKINQIQGKFDGWFKRKIGVSPKRAVIILYSIGNYIEETLNDEILPATRQYSVKQAEEWSALKRAVEVVVDGEVLSVECSSKKDAEAFLFFYKFNQMILERIPLDIKHLDISPLVSESEEFGLKKLLAFSKESFKEKIHSLKDIRAYPLYELSDGRILFSYFSNIFDMLWDSFDRVAKADNQFFDKKYQKHKSKWVEDKAVEFLKRIFPDSSVYQTVDYRDVSKGGVSTAELDIAILYEPFLIIVEVKAKQFRTKSQYGNPSMLRSDIKANIEDAYKQSLRAINYIDATEAAIFTERKSGRKFTVRKGDTYKIYPVSVSLHRLATVATQLNKTQELKLFLENNYPFATCLSDLDLITRIKITPEVFLHYLERRLKVLEGPEEHMGDELDLFGAYLDTRLHRNNFGFPDEQMAMISFAGYNSLQFDRLIAYENGEDIDKPEIKLNVPDEINELLTYLKKKDNREGRVIAFSLLELDDEFLISIAENVAGLRGKDIPDEIFRRITFSSDEVAVSIVASNDFLADRLPEKVYQRVLLEKYRRKVNKGIGIGVVVKGNGLVFVSAFYAESLWKKDSDMDHLIENDSPFVPSSGVKLPGVNQPCICGSGKKFKKCCKRKIEDSRRNYPFQ